MIIEFCGVPGGGKSTAVATYCATHPGAKLITLDMRRRLPELYWAARFALSHPASFCTIIYFAFCHHMRGLGLYSVHLALRACGKYAKALSDKGGIIDEGIVHVLMTLAPEPLTPGELRRTLSHLLLPDVTVVAREGNFHRFHGARDVPHPRALVGERALGEWEAAVRANVAAVAALLPEARVEVEEVEQNTI